MAVDRGLKVKAPPGVDTRLRALFRKSKPAFMKWRPREKLTVSRNPHDSPIALLRNGYPAGSSVTNGPLPQLICGYPIVERPGIPSAFAPSMLCCAVCLGRLFRV